MSRLALLLLPVPWLAACGVSDCSAPCEQQKGAWLAQTTCAEPDLRLRWSLDLGTAGGQCRIQAGYCDKLAMKTQEGAHDCQSQLTTFQIGTAVCALTVGAGPPTAVCRGNGKICEFTFVKQGSQPDLACNLPPDAGADAPPDAGADAFDTGGEASDAPSDRGPGP